MEEAVRKLVNYLSYFGSASFLNPNFENPRSIDFAGIELITSREIVDGLLEEINHNLNKETGFPASLRAVQWAEFQGGKFKYMVEIIPYSHIPVSDYAEATKEIIRVLPKIIKNYRMKKHK
jgi:hypothetical protein